jgi:hypothetical protein
MLMLPAAPEVAEPVRMTIEPLLPLDVVPDFIDTPPLTPDAPALAVRRENAPLLDTLP